MEFVLDNSVLDRALQRAATTAGVPLYLRP